jgi:hypothetical protein
VIVSKATAIKLLNQSISININHSAALSAFSRHFIAFHFCRLDSSFVTFCLRRSTDMALSAAVQALIIKARIMSFEPWRSSHPRETVAIFQTADDNRLYLTDAELATIAASAPEFATFIPVAQRLRDEATTIVDEARAKVLAAFPGITAEGGDLYPAERAEACWRDFWHFLRCITYAIAGKHPHYTSHHGLEAMQQLYTTLNVPLEAMVYGLQGLKVASLQRLDPALADSLSPYFDHLTERVSFRGQRPDGGVGMGTGMPDRRRSAIGD